MKGTWCCSHQYYSVINQCFPVGRISDNFTTCSQELKRQPTCQAMGQWKKKYTHTYKNNNNNSCTIVTCFVQDSGVKAAIPKLHQASLHKVVCSSREQIPSTKEVTGKAGRGWGDRAWSLFTKQEQRQKQGPRASNFQKNSRKGEQEQRQNIYTGTEHPEVPQLSFQLLWQLLPRVLCTFLTSLWVKLKFPWSQEHTCKTGRGWAWKGSRFAASD